ncbi:MAG: transketolase [Desulfobacteraceae bacterium]|nr:MAG: transketolase [Desulfobacteraceae bacterium]
MDNPFAFEPGDISTQAAEIRKRVLKMNFGAGQGHTGADLSETDILAALYFRLLRYDRHNPENPGRDRFVLSKGHGVGGFYCTLMQAGLLDESLAGTYLGFDSRLPGHPVRQKTPFVEVNTGALGHGLAIGVGMALAAKKQNLEYKVYVLTGDGELQEGSNWEAAMTAQQYKLDNLIWIIDRNGLQLADFTENINALEPLDRKLEAFGMELHQADGNDPEALVRTIESLEKNDRPKAILARTTKGCGVSFIENQPAWHHKIPTENELSQAMEELSC